MPPSWPELLLGLAFMLLVANAARRGCLREGSLLLGLGLAMWLAHRFYPLLSPASVPAGSGGPWPVILYLGMVLVLLIAAAGLSAFAAPLVQSGPLRLIDHLAGFALGLAEATLVVGLLATGGERLGALHPPPGGLVARAIDVAGLSLTWLATMIPSEILIRARH